MKSFRQLLRQPVKFVAGLILMTVAAAILCVCVGQALAARNTAEKLNQQFTTVALAKGEEGIDENGILRSVIRPSDELRAWLEEIEQSDSEIVKTVAEHGLLSASIPELTPLNYTQGGFIAERFSGGNHLFYIYDPENDGRPYSSAMLVITLEEVSEPVQLFTDGRNAMGQALAVNDFSHQELFFNWQEQLGENLSFAGYTVTLSGTVTEVVSLQEGFRDPVGMIARLKLYLPLAESLEAMELEVGQSYLVYGMDYYDEDWAFRSLLADERGENIKIDAFDPRSLHYYITEEELNDPELPDQKIVAGYTVNLSNAQDSDKDPPTQIILQLTAAEVKRINAVSMTLWKDFRYIGAEASARINLDCPYVYRWPNVTYGDQNGETVTMTWAEYRSRYQIPNITRLEASAEDFLQSEEGIPWREALERDGVNHHAFAVLGVDNAMYLAWFAQEEAKITQGRDITEEEAASGAKVCVIHEEVAVANGLEIGDTVTLNLYQGDNGLPYQGLLDFGGDLLIPSADFYFSTTPIQETAEYTVIGLWRGPETWPDIALNEYSLSPNTVIVPKSSVQTAWEHPKSVLYSSTILNNGKIQEFQNLARQAGFYYSFTFFDQGYTELVGNFNDYEMLAQQVLIVGSVVYGVILLLFLLLYPGTQSKAVGTMESLGAPRGKRFAHVMNFTIGIAAPATVLGGGLGLALWQKVVDALQATAESTVALQLDPIVLILLALAQLAFVLTLTAVQAIFVSAPKGMSRKAK